MWCIRRTAWLSSLLTDKMQCCRPFTCRGGGLTHRAPLQLELQAVQI